MVVETSGVTFMDMTGLGFLLGLRGATSGLRLVAPSPYVMFGLHEPDVDGLFDILPNAGSDESGATAGDSRG